MMEIGGQMGRFYIKFSNSARMQTVLQDAKWQLEYRNDIGELSQENTELADWECRKLK